MVKRQNSTKAGEKQVDTNNAVRARKRSKEDMERAEELSRRTPFNPGAPSKPDETAAYVEEALNSGLRDLLQAPDLFDKLMMVSRSNSIKDFAIYLGIAESTVNNAKRGRRIPSGWVLDVTLRTGACLRELLMTPMPEYAEDIDVRTFQPIPEPSLDRFFDGLNKNMEEIHKQIKAATKSRGLRTDLWKKCGGSADLFVYTIKSRSMEPRITTGCTVYVNMQRRHIYSGNIYMMLLDTGPIIGRVFQTVLPTGIHGYQMCFDNKDMDPFYLSLEDMKNVIGQVVWAGGPV